MSDQTPEPSEPNGGNFYRPHVLLISAGTFWRCKHGNTGLASKTVGCLQCALDYFSDLETERDQLRAELAANLESIPSQYRVDVHEGGAFENIAASLAVSVAKMAAELAKAQQPEKESQSYTESDGCPTEIARLKREWRTLTAELEQAREDKAIVDWLETKDCWIGVAGDYDITPEISAGGCYAQTIREAYRAARLAAKTEK